eukprot:667978-Alexandrium_andersonii.AAC.1
MLDGASRRTSGRALKAPRHKGADADARLRLAVPEEDGVVAEPGREAELQRRRPRCTPRASRTNCGNLWRSSEE